MKFRLHSTQYTLHSTQYTLLLLHSTQYTLLLLHSTHSFFYTLHSAHSFFYTLHSTHSFFNTVHSTHSFFYTVHSTHSFFVSFRKIYFVVLIIYNAKNILSFSIKKKKETFVYSLYYITRYWPADLRILNICIFGGYRRSCVQTIQNIDLDYFFGSTHKSSVHLFSCTICKNLKHPGEY